MSFLSAINALCLALVIILVGAPSIMAASDDPMYNRISQSECCRTLVNGSAIPACEIYNLTTEECSEELAALDAAYAEWQKQQSLHNWFTAGIIIIVLCVGLTLLSKLKPQFFK